MDTIKSDDRTEKYYVSLNDAIDLERLGFNWTTKEKQPKNYYYYNGKDLCAPNYSQVLNWLIHKHDMYVVDKYRNNPHGGEEGELYFVYRIGYYMEFRLLGGKFFKLDTLLIEVERFVVGEVIKLLKERAESSRLELRRNKILKLERDLCKTFCEKWKLI